MCEDPFQDECDVARLTHGHPSGYLVSGAFALIISRVMCGDALLDASRVALAVLCEHDGHAETTGAISSALDLATGHKPSANAVESLGEGWVAEEALAIALYCALVADDFRHGVLLAVNHSGDSDSTGSMAGQLLDAEHGIERIPPDWIAGLEGRDVIERITEDLIQHFVVPAQMSDEERHRWLGPRDMDRYPPN